MKSRAPVLISKSCRRVFKAMKIKKYMGSNLESESQSPTLLKSAYISFKATSLVCIAASVIYVGRGLLPPKEIYPHQNPTTKFQEIDNSFRKHRYGMDRSLDGLKCLVGACFYSSSASFYGAKLKKKDESSQ